MSFSLIAVVGAGPKGLSIAEAIAAAEIPVTVVCMTSARRGLARTRLERTLSMRVDIGEVSRVEGDAILSRVTLVRDLSHLNESAVEGAECDLVIESSVGDIRMRRAVLATVEGCISRGAVLASDVGRDDLEAMSEVLVRRDQFLGMRFFHPASHTPNIEVATLLETAPGVLSACETFCRWIGKTPVDRVESDAAPVVSSAIQAVG